jgi:hypothetical protein
MEKRVVLFGAGASYGARPNPSPPMGKYLHKWVLKNLNNLIKNDQDLLEADGKLPITQKLKSRLEGAHSYEDLAKVLHETGERDCLMELNFRLAAFMTPPRNPNNPDEEPRVDDSFIEQPDLFDEWLKKTVRKSENLKHFTFITLNYDCLLERAICRTFFTPDENEGQCLCTHVYYPFIGGPETGVELLKLHGSINWIGDPLGNSENNKIPTPIFIEASGISHYKNIEVLPNCINRDPSEMIIATYAPGKPPQANPRLFQDIQNRVMKKITQAQNVAIIGVHIPQEKQDDPSLWDLFQSLRGKNVDFINPCEEESSLAKISFGFNPIKKSFKEYVDSQS